MMERLTSVKEKINSRTILYALIGKPVKHSLSPLMHNVAFSYCGLNSCYLSFEVEEQNIKEAIEGVKSLGFGGLNITAPYKEKVIPFLEKVSPEAGIIKSVNTVVNKNGSLHGFTTDGEGFCRFIQEDVALEIKKNKVLIIGAGGAARAVAHSLALKGCDSITIANRTHSKACDLSELLIKATGNTNIKAIPLEMNKLADFFTESTLVVNSLPLDDELIKKVISDLTKNSKKRCIFNDRFFVDLRYNPEETELMKLFRKGGGSAFNGKGMLLWQAVAAFELFTGNIKAPVEIMRKAIKL